MGTHISRVKSVDLDAWTDEQLQGVVNWGNARANKYVSFLPFLSSRSTGGMLTVDLQIGSGRRNWRPGMFLLKRELLRFLGLDLNCTSLADVDTEKSTTLSVPNMKRRDGLWTALCRILRRWTMAAAVVMMMCLSQ